MIPYIRYCKLPFTLCLIICIQCFCVSGQNQKHRIQGKIINAANNKPIEDVMISIKGTAIGTRSKHEGNFSLIDSFPAMDSTTQVLFTDVCFLHMAYKERTIKFGTSTVTNSDSLFSINLVPDTILIDLISRKRMNSTTVENKGITQANYPATPKRSDHAEHAYIILDGAEYPGGFHNLLSDVKKLTTKAAIEHGISGNALIVFEVNQLGEVTCVNALESTNNKVRREAKKIVTNLKGWKPAYQHGKPVASKHLINVEFK